jgi:hypothetical protein
LKGSFIPSDLFWMQESGTWMWIQVKGL